MNTDVCYLTFPLPSVDQAASFARYLHRHGYSAVAEANEVTCPLDEDPSATTADLVMLRQNWRRWWNHQDAELFSLPVFVKPTCGECV